MEDHVEALECILEKARPGSRYNIGGGCEVANIDLVHRICGIMDERANGRAPHDRHISFVTDRKGHDRRYAINSARLASELGWKARRAFGEGLEQTVDWYLANAEWCRRALARVA